MKILPIPADQLDAYSVGAIVHQRELIGPELGRTPTAKCSVCGIDTCVGHCCHIKLPFVIPHPVYYNMVPMILTSFCAVCDEVLVPHDDISLFSEYYRVITSPQFSSETNVCRCTIPTVRVYKYGWTRTRTDGYKLNDELYEIHILQSGKTVKDSMPMQAARERLKSITSDQMVHMRLDPCWRPEDLIIDYMMVMPPLLRPQAQSSFSHDRATNLYKAVLDIVNDSNRRPSHQIQTFNHYLELLGKSAEDETRLIKRFISGKTGLIRSNLLSVRNNRCARTVITTNSYIWATHVGVPRSFRRSLTVFEYLSPDTASDVASMFKHGIIMSLGTLDAHTHLGVHTVSQVEAMSLEDIVTGLVKACAHGSVSAYVERMLFDDDWVFINRQPTLQRTSILAFRAKLVDSLTMELNLAVTKPFNADFDGDEMSIYVASDADSRMECESILAVERNIFAADTGELLVQPIQDCVSAVYAMTKFNAPCTMQMLLQVVDTCHMSGYSIHKWSTREFMQRHERVQSDLTSTSMLSTLLPSAMTVSLSYMDVQDGIITRVNPMVRSNQAALIRYIHTHYGAKYTIWYISMIQLVADIWLHTYPLSVSYTDCCAIPDTVIQTMRRHYDECLDRVINYEVCKDLYPDMSQYFEMQILTIIQGQVSSRIRSQVKDYMLEHMPTNPFTVMIDSGARGDFTSAVNMMVFLCQQEVNGRQSCMYGTPIQDRTDPTNHGFVLEPYSTGLGRKGTYYQAAAGRQGIVNTGSGVSDPGVLYRLLWSFLADIKVDNAGRVVNHVGTVLQPR